MNPTFRRRFLLSLPLGLLVVVALFLYADVQEAARTLRGFRWEFLPLILALTVFNYLLRFLKWQFYLGQIGVRGLPWPESLLLFFSGLAMVITPGKVGEWLKCYLLRERTGTPFSRSAPIIVAERLSDGIALLLLALGGLLLFRQGWPVALAAGLGAATIVFLARSPRLALGLLGLMARAPLLAPLAAVLRETWSSASVLLSPRNLALAVALGTVSWAGECLAFFFVLVGLGVPPSGLLAVQSAFILALATLAGSLLLLPGGLGVAEGGIAALSQLLLGLGRGPAAVGALLIRLCTLWFGVVLGVLALSLASRWLLARTPVTTNER